MLSTALGAGIIIPPHIYPPNLPILDPIIALACLPYVITAIIAALFGWLLAYATQKKFGGKLNLLNIILPTLLLVLVSVRFGFGTEFVQGSILCFLLLFASNSDIHIREVPDSVSIMIAITALIGKELANIPIMLLAAVLITLPQLAIAIIKPNTYGGADIKLMAACAFLLGFEKGLIAIIVGLLIAVICTVITREMKNQSLKDPFALIPYLAAGSMLAYFI